MESPLRVYTRTPWIDHPQGPIWTVTHTWYTTITIATGVAFGLVQPSFERIIVHLLAWACYSLNRPQHVPNQAQPNEPASEHVPLLPGQPSRRSKKQCFPSDGWSTHCSKQTVARILFWILTISVIVWSVAGAFATSVSAEGPALSASKICGLWGLRDDPNSAAIDADSPFQGEKEIRAGLYARDCYGPKSAISLDQCMLFRYPTIPTSTVETGQRCPFINETYCSGTGFTAARFSTGLVDASMIGINAAATPKFNRTTMCVPLNIEGGRQGPGFVERTNETLTGWWRYNLGPVDSDAYHSQYTFEQSGDPFYYDVRSYTMSTYLHVYSKAKHQNYWQPTPALNIRHQLNKKSRPYSITLMFINSCHIYYKQASDDPIFPADFKWPPGSDLWINNDSRARPLACIDWIEVCTHDGICTEPYKDNEDVDENFVFTRYALNKSNAFHSIEFRGATGLDAQYKIKDDTSSPLSQDPPQWILESWRLFNTSLSRVQYDALDIANGTGWDNTLYVPKMPGWVRGKMCYIFTFQLPKGYDNIRIGIYILILAGPLAVFVVGWETSYEFSEKRKESGHFDDLKLIGIEWSARWLKTLFTRTHDVLPRVLDQNNNDATREEGRGVNVGADDVPNYGAINSSAQPDAPIGSADNETVDVSDSQDQENVRHDPEESTSSMFRPEAKRLDEPSQYPEDAQP